MHVERYFVAELRAINYCYSWKLPRVALGSFTWKYFSFVFHCVLIGNKLGKNGMAFPQTN